MALDAFRPQIIPQTEHHLAIFLLNGFKQSKGPIKQLKWLLHPYLSTVSVALAFQWAFTETDAETLSPNPPKVLGKLSRLVAHEPLPSIHN